MTFTFETINFPEIGEPLTKDKFAWVPVKLTFAKPGHDLHFDISLRVTVNYGQDWSVQRICEAAFEEAKALLGAAHALLAEHDLQELQQLSDEFEGNLEAPITDAPPDL